MKHAWRSGTVWYTETVASAYMGASVSLVIKPDPPHRIHIAYHDFDAHDLRHAWFGREFLAYLPLVVKD